MKRTFDLVVSAIALLLAAPLMAVLSLLIRWDSEGPAIFRQERIGRHGKRFDCLKLRTMRHGTPSRPTHEVGAAELTRLGYRLRRWKLDELPQLWNVFRGEMSLVGPRPCLPSQSVLIEERRRLGVLALRPGMTGIAQIRGIDMSDPVKLARIDACYVGRASLANDITILARTLSLAALADRIGHDPEDNL